MNASFRSLSKYWRCYFRPLLQLSLVSPMAGGGKWKNFHFKLLIESNFKLRKLVDGDYWYIENIFKQSVEQFKFVFPIIYLIQLDIFYGYLIAR